MKPWFAAEEGVEEVRPVVGPGPPVPEPSAVVDVAVVEAPGGVGKLASEEEVRVVARRVGEKRFVEDCNLRLRDMSAEEKST
jgi:hypothetical protein